ncbi:MAG TPA: TMEM175 family protein [Chitinophagaceae bacterium]|nr:TMEM175 family protein [Chitinophagaceae bacterium]
MQQKQDGGHNRKQFQVDRVAFFSDAVIAIAITLLVLEIKIPPIDKNATFSEIVSKYGESFFLHGLALLICFISIGNLWIKHHDLYEHIVNYSKALIKSNLYFLLSIVLLPVSISFLFGEESPMWLKLFTYFINLALCNFTYFCMLRVVYHSKHNFSALRDVALIKKSKISTLLATLAFASAAVLAMFKFEWFYAPFFVFPAARVAARIIKSRGKKSDTAAA